MTNIVEFKVSKTIFGDVKADPQFRMGFEAEFHVRNASALLADQRGRFPRDFVGYSVTLDKARALMQGGRGEGDTFPAVYYQRATILHLATQFEQYLGLATGSVVTDGVDYTKWALTVDDSLYTNPESLYDPTHDLGVELISPVMTLSDGLQWMLKVFDMIGDFRVAGVSLYTTDMCGLHVNLSHTLMERGFDYAKLAILGGDEHYLQDFQRLKPPPRPGSPTDYAQPLLRAVQGELSQAKVGPMVGLEGKPQASDLLALRGWNAERVMTDLSALIPMDHHMSVDFRRLSTNNPYIEIRIAGNRGYEHRFDEIARLAIRYGALIKIACDPAAYREEYLKKVYALVSGVGTAPPPAREDPFPRIHAFLSPVMSTITRNALNTMQRYYSAQTLTIPNGSSLFLQIVRSALDMRLHQTVRVRQGLMLLLSNVLHIRPEDVLKVLKNGQLLQRYGIIRPGEKPANIVAVLTNYLKSLNQPVALVQ